MKLCTEPRFFVFMVEGIKKISIPSRQHFKKCIESQNVLIFPLITIEN